MSIRSGRKAQSGSSRLLSTPRHLGTIGKTIISGSEDTVSDFNDKI
jgi:hypothetical protein